MANIIMAGGGGSATGNAVAADVLKGKTFSNASGVSIPGVLEVGEGSYLSHIEDWATSASAADIGWRAICYGNGLFVATAIDGTGNRVMTSPDGITWTTRTSAGDYEWRCVCYGNGLFVSPSVDGMGKIMTSPDGITWTLRDAPAYISYYGVCYGNGKFVAVASSGSSNRAMYSSDGITWTVATTPVDNGWRGVCYGAGLFVAVATTGTGNRVMTSPDGINWTIRTSAADRAWESVCYGNGLFVAVGSSGGIMTSPDGITWTLRTSPNSNGLVSVAYGQGYFMAVSIDGTNRAIQSVDGINWVEATCAIANGWRNVCYGLGRFVAVAGTGTGNRVMTTRLVRELVADNISTEVHVGPLVAATRPSVMGWMSDMIYDGNKFVLLGRFGQVATSEDGITWTLRSGVPSDGEDYWGGLCYANGVYVAVTEGIKALRSTDGISWVEVDCPLSRWNDTTYGKGLFVSVGYVYNTIAMTSPDGAIWTQRNFPAGFEGSPRKVAYGNGIFVAFCYAIDGAWRTANPNRYLTSATGTDWVVRVGPTDRIADVCFGNGVFLAAEYATGKTFTSSDGVVWTERVTLTAVPASLNYIGDRFVSVSRGNGIQISKDGITWSAVISNNGISMYRGCYGKGKFIAFESGTSSNDYAIAQVTRYRVE